MREVSLKRLVSKWKKDGDAKGVVALKALDYCNSDNLPPPEWITQDIVDCWFYYSTGTPATAWEADVSNDLRRGVVPLTLDDAFGVPSRSKPNSKLLVRMHWYGPKLDAYFQNNTQTPDGFAAAALTFGITPSNAKDWLREYRRFINAPPPME